MPTIIQVNIEVSKTDTFFHELDILVSEGNRHLAMQRDGYPQLASYMVVRAVHQSHCSYGRITSFLQEKHLHGVPVRQFSASYPPVKNMLDIFYIYVVTLAAKYGTRISDSLIQEMLAAGKS